MEGKDNHPRCIHGKLFGECTYDHIITDSPTPPSEEREVDCKHHPAEHCSCYDPAPTEKECCALCSKETLYDDTNAPDCTDPNCPCHSRPEESWEEEFEMLFNAHPGIDKYLDYAMQTRETLKSFIRQTIEKERIALTAKFQSEIPMLKEAIRHKDRAILREKVEGVRGTVFGNDVVSRADILAVLKEGV